MNQIGKRNQSLIQRLTWARTTLARFTDWFHTRERGLTRRLFEDAELAETRDDKNQQQDVISIKYFHCDITVGGEKATARIMAKETLENGHRIYTIELQELNKPAELKNRNGTNSSAGSEGSSLSIHIADSRSSEEPSAETIPQEEDGGKANIAGDDEYLQAVDDFKNAKTDEQRRSSFRRLTGMVERAAEATGFTNAVPEQTVAYKVRTTAPPKWIFAVMFAKTRVGSYNNHKGGVTG